MTVPAGMTRQVWLTFHPVDVEPGTYEGQIMIPSGVGSKSFPLRMHLYPLAFPEKQSLHLGGWDYTDEVGKTNFVTKQNQLLIVRHLREHFVDSPWGTPRILNPYYPQVRGTYDAQGAMTVPPDTTKFDAWIESWPGAAQYHIFVRVGGGGFPAAPHGSWAMDTPEFTTAVKAWTTFWAGHMVKKGLKPEQLALLLVDEPDEEPQRDHIILAWARAMRAADTGVRIWENPNHRDMAQAMEEMIDACHVVCPHFGIYQNSSSPVRPPEPAQAYRDYYVKKRDQGIGLEFYSAHGPSRLMDPYAYYRHMAWACWHYGATGMYFWSLTDTGGASSWNEYVTTRLPYTPLFIDKDSVTAGKHLEALREGVEDYEYCVMLERAIREATAQGATGPKLEEARRLMEELPVRVFEAGVAGYPQWLDANVDRTLAGQGAGTNIGGVDSTGETLSSNVSCPSVTDKPSLPHAPPITHTDPSASRRPCTFGQLSKGRFTTGGERARHFAEVTGPKSLGLSLLLACQLLHPRARLIFAPSVETPHRTGNSPGPTQTTPIPPQRCAAASGTLVGAALFPRETLPGSDRVSPCGSYIGQPG